MVILNRINYIGTIFFLFIPALIPLILEIRTNEPHLLALLKSLRISAYATFYFIGLICYIYIVKGTNYIPIVFLYIVLAFSLLLTLTLHKIYLVKGNLVANQFATMDMGKKIDLYERLTKLVSLIPVLFIASIIGFHIKFTLLYQVIGYTFVYLSFTFLGKLIEYTRNININLNLKVKIGKQSIIAIFIFIIVIIALLIYCYNGCY